MHVRVLTIAVAMTMLGGVAAGTSAQTFDFSPDKFRTTLNARLKQDGHDPIVTCRSSSAEMLCHFRNDPFAGRRGRLGGIDHDELMTLDVAGNKVAGITLAGQRGSSATEARFIGQVASALGVLAPALDKDKIAEIVSKLGLSRGDDAPNIGESMGQSGDFGDVQCLNQYGSVSMVIACTITPPQK